VAEKSEQLIRLPLISNHTETKNYLA
jgi:hypothetical protein